MPVSETGGGSPVRQPQGDQPKAKTGQKPQKPGGYGFRCTMLYLKSLERPPGSKRADSVSKRKLPIAIQLMPTHKQVRDLAVTEQSKEALVQNLKSITTQIRMLEKTMEGLTKMIKNPELTSDKKIALMKERNEIFNKLRLFEQKKAIYDFAIERRFGKQPAPTVSKMAPPTKGPPIRGKPSLTLSINTLLKRQRGLIDSINNSDNQNEISELKEELDRVNTRLDELNQQKAKLENIIKEMHTTEKTLLDGARGLLELLKFTPNLGGFGQKSIAQIEESIKIIEQFHSKLESIANDDSKTIEEKTKAILELYNSADFKTYAESFKRLKVLDVKFIKGKKLQKYQKRLSQKLKKSKIPDERKHHWEEKIRRLADTYNPSIFAVQRMPRHMLMIGELKKSASMLSNEELDTIAASAFEKAGNYCLEVNKAK